MSVWRVVAPLLFLLAVVGLVSLVAVSGAFAPLEREVVVPVTTSATVVVPLLQSGSSEASATPDAAVAGAGETPAEPSD